MWILRECLEQEIETYIGGFEIEFTFYTSLRRPMYYLVLFRAYCTFVNDLRFVQSRLYSNLHGLNNKICDEMKYPVKKNPLNSVRSSFKKEWDSAKVSGI